MFADKSILLEQINFAINNKWCQKKGGDLNSSFRLELMHNYADLIDKNYSSQCKNTESIEMLGHRIAELEQQNEQLLGLINILFENLPELIMNILTTHPETEFSALHGLSKGEQYVEPIKENCVTEQIGPCPTRRERDILELLMKGLCAKEIAHELFISETTVITHKKNLKEKFHARNTAELIFKAHLHM